MIKRKKERRCCLIWHGKRRCFVARCRTDTGWRRGDPRVLRIFFFSFISLSLLLSLLRRKAKSDAIDGSVRRHGCVSVGGCRRRRLTTASLSVALLHQGKRRRLRRWLSSRKGHGDLPICLFPLLGGIVASSISGKSKAEDQGLHVKGKTFCIWSGELDEALLITFGGLWFVIVDFYSLASSCNGKVRETKVLRLLIEKNPKFVDLLISQQDTGMGSYEDSVELSSSQVPFLATQ
ncbi:hypothetical protein IGI04_007848, partial [Brassica rapa subsp. trilocularis]